MKAVSLQSGSNGNCIYVETKDLRILFDAGISGIQAEERLRTIGREIRDVDCVVISHDHTDHARCAGIFSRKYGLDVRMTRKTHSAVMSSGGCGPIRGYRTSSPARSSPSAAPSSKRFQRRMTA